MIKDPHELLKDDSTKVGDIIKKHKTIQEAWDEWKEKEIYIPPQRLQETIFRDGWQAKTDSLPEKRTYPQLQYYWACVIDIISKDTGYTPREVHTINKATLPYPHRVEVRDRKGALFIHASTEDMKRQEFMDWIEFTICPLWMEQGIPNIPKPMQKKLWESYISDSER